MSISYSLYLFDVVGNSTAFSVENLIDKNVRIAWQECGKRMVLKYEEYFHTFTGVEGITK